MFTQVPFEETIDYILDQIYVQNKLPAIASKLIFKRLLYKVTQGTVFSFNGSLYRQVDGCGMGNPLSPVLANIFMCKLENDVLAHHTLTFSFYDRYVEDCFAKRPKNEPDKLLEDLNSYLHNIKFAVEENPSHYLDTEFKFTGNKFKRSVYKKPGKFPTHWSSQVPNKYKRNAIIGALHRAKKISTDWETEVKINQRNFPQRHHRKL